MGIKLDVIAKDAQGLPVVSWLEDRNHFAPGVGGRERVSCFIRPDETGELHLVAVGKVRHGEDVETRPWRKLTSFSLAPAGKVYRTAQEEAIVVVLSKKNQAAGVLLTDGAHVVIAHFEGPEGFDAPMHLNCADASEADAKKLYAILTREFIGQRGAVLTAAACRGETVWPKSAPPFVPYAPAKLAPPPPWIEPLANLTVAAELALLGFGFYWFVVR